MSEPVSRRALRALELRRAGVSALQIAEELDYDSPVQAEADIVVALRANQTAGGAAGVRELEADRLERLQQSLWVKAVKGDVQAADRVMKLAELRVKLAGVSETGVTVMVDAYDSAVAALAVRAEDEALIAAGRRLAERIDSAGATGDSTAETKALYLVPHLLNVLRELGATPAARSAVGAVAKGEVSEKARRLRSLREAAAG